VKWNVTLPGPRLATYQTTFRSSAAKRPRQANEEKEKSELKVGASRKEIDWP
jgi:hypothetical protein